MLTTTIATHLVHLDDEGFLADPDEWSDDLATALAGQIGLTLTDEHWAAIRFAREDFAEHHESPTVRRIAVAGGIPTKVLFGLFPQKPAKKLAYVSGLPKPRGCV
jgi:TusE/DsrC/DsvC family sulfur relay protein